MRAYVEESLALFAPHLGVGIAEDEANRGEEVTLARTVATDDDVVLGREGLNDRLVLVAAEQSARCCGSLPTDAPLEALDNNLFDVHGDPRRARGCRVSRALGWNVVTQWNEGCVELFFQLRRPLYQTASRRW